MARVGWHWSDKHHAVVEALGLSLNCVLLAKSRVLKRLRQEVAGLVE
jgi:hypothetical protein